VVVSDTLYVRVPYVVHPCIHTIQSIDTYTHPYTHFHFDFYFCSYFYPYFYSYFYSYLAFDVVRP